MTSESSQLPAARCLQCGFEAPAKSNDWTTVDDPLFGGLTRCPACKSTDVHTGM
jgi:predicted Zn-ribbon and HTH transcriptional regulator